MQILRLLLFPFSLLYGLVVLARNWLYDAGLFKSREFDLPVIAVGNLDVGGAGKSPMTEYLVRLLQHNHAVATLSRGYGRTTRGFVVADKNSAADQIGDEPAQFKAHFPGVTVAVCEDRAYGIERLRSSHDVIILDDAFQHRKVKPGYSILLFDYSRITGLQLMLPAGNLREPFSGRWRADVIVITKCPAGITTEQQKQVIEKVKPLPYQSVFFTSITYHPFTALLDASLNGAIDADTTVFLLTGIANAKPLLRHLNSLTSKLIHHEYPDHHRFTLKNISKLASDFEECSAHKKIIVTTEKDAQRLRERALKVAIQRLPIYVIPIGVEFLNNAASRFDQLITDYVRENTANHHLH